MKDLESIRKDIDSIDRQLIDLFKMRMDCAKAVGEYKKKNNLPVLNQDRENQVLDKVENLGGEYGTFSRLLYSNIMELSRALQHTIMGSGEKLRNEITRAKSKTDTTNIRVAYQGIKGANAHEAVLRLFPKGIPDNYASWEDVFDAVDKGAAACGVLPVENSSAGSVSGVYDLILKHRFYIVGALDLPIDYCLAAIKQTDISEIEQVRSHPQALSQCANYTARHGFKAVPSVNTAVSALEVANEKRLNVASLCSEKAAQEYGLKALDRHIQDNKDNTTRFIVISKELVIPEDADKISLCFGLPHVTGSLYSVLCRFNSLGLNLTKIESRPMLSKGFEYLFYLDFTGNVRSENVLNLLCALSEELPDFSFFGNYSEI